MLSKKSQYAFKALTYLAEKYNKEAYHRFMKVVRGFFGKKAAV